MFRLLLHSFYYFQFHAIIQQETLSKSIMLNKSNNYIKCLNMFYCQFCAQKKTRATQSLAGIMENVHMMAMAKPNAYAQRDLKAKNAKVKQIIM